MKNKHFNNLINLVCKSADSAAVPIDKNVFDAILRLQNLVQELNAK